MKKSGKPIFFIVLVLIIAFTYLSFAGVSTYFGDNKISYVKGISDIRWGIDISGGVEAAFTPPESEIENITTDDMKKAEQIIKQRLVNQNITDAEVVRDDMGNKSLYVSLGKATRQTLTLPLRLKSSVQWLC